MMHLFSSVTRRPNVHLSLRMSEPCDTVVISTKPRPRRLATHVPIAVVCRSSQAELTTWLRDAMRGTGLVLHLGGDETLDGARRIAWLAEACRRFDVDLELSVDALTRRGLELLNTLGADRIRVDEALAGKRHGRALARRVRPLAEALSMHLAA
jgi:hypothetical protein